MLQAHAVNDPPHITTARVVDRSGLAVAVEGSSACSFCSLRSGCLPRDLGQADLDSFSTIARLKRKIRRGASIFRAGDSLVAVYVVRSGTFKSTNVCRCGKQKITGFYLSGDMIGLDAFNDSVHPYDAIALEDSEVCVLPVHHLERMASAMPAIQRQLIRALSRDISRDHGLMQLLGCMDAEQRVARLLLNLVQRYHRLGYASDELFLHMTRDEIASYLDLSSETVSRVLSRLQSKGLLAVHQRHIQFTDPDRLAECGVSD